MGERKSEECRIIEVKESRRREDEMGIEGKKKEGGRVYKKERKR